MESSALKYRFDAVEFHPANLRLTVAGEARTMEPKSCRLLAFLIERQGQVISKEEILRVVWEGVAVSDNALTRAITQIRKALDDDAKEPRFIETVPTVGYRFIGILRPEDTSESSAPPAARPAKPLPLGMWAVIAIAVVAVAGLVAWLVKPKAAPRSAEAAVPVPLTTYRGSEIMPSFSPDGSQVAFAWSSENDDNYDIYVKVVGSDSTPVRLTSAAEPDLWPSWSPDGRTIAFHRVFPAGREELILIPALGGPERKLSESPIWPDAEGFTTAWTSDSKWLIASRVVGDISELFRISAETGESEQITHPLGTLLDNFPVISPDGKTLLFTRMPPYTWGDLYRVAINRDAKPVGEPQRIPAGDYLVGNGRWTANGEEILTKTFGGILRLPASGTDHPEKLVWMPGAIAGLDISRRGDRLTYAQVHGDSNVWRIDLSAKSTPPQRLIASTFRDVYPQYSPDGKKITFFSNRSGQAEIWISNADGTQPRQLTFYPKGSTGTAAWSPDGKTLAFDSNEGGSYQIYTMSAEGGKATRLTEGTSNFAASWSRDGKWIYFASSRTGHTEVWKMPAGGGAAVQVTHHGGVKAIESPDGKTLYFSKDNAAGSLWKMPSDGSGKEDLIADSLYRFNFAVTQRGIYFMASPAETGATSLKFYDTATGNTSLILRMGQPEFGLDVSPDGKYLVYDQLDDWQGDLMLVENFH